MDILKKENMQIIEKAADWREAIRISVTPLVEHGYVKECYIDAIIENVETLGAYFLIAPGVAMPHARPEQGVVNTQLGITLLKQPVIFDGKDEPTKLLIVLAAADNDKHIEAMGKIAEALADEIKVKKLCEAESVDALYKLFIGSGEEK